MTTAPDRVFHVSDVHFGIEDARAHAAFADAVRVERPDGVICTGDITQRATHAQFAAAAEYFASLDVPVMLFPGNHDMPYYNLLERFTRPYARSDWLAAQVSQPLQLRHAVLVPFDTNARAQWRWPWSNGNVKHAKLAVPLRALDGLADDPRLKIVACHHPLLPARDGETNPTIRGDTAFAALARAGATAILSGHVHVPFDQQRERDGQTMRMIGAGTLSRRLRGAAPSYNVLNIANGTIAVEPRELT